MVRAGTPGSCTTRVTVSCAWSAARSIRKALHQWLRAGNPDLDWDEAPASNPDGDGELDDDQVARFRLVGCECCGADLLKPDVVFFGEVLPTPAGPPWQTGPRRRAVARAPAWPAGRARTKSAAQVLLPQAVVGCGHRP